ncbi:MAG TPA: type II secretion system protein [Thermoanaerobaculia bacterium]
MRTERRAAGYTLLEMVFALAIFGLICTVLFVLTAEMRFAEKHLPINMHKNPQVIAVLARLRRDVLDAASRQPYEKTYGVYTSSDKVLIVETMMASGGQQTVIWDFRTPGEVRRRAYNVGVVADDWVTRGLPVDFSNLEIDAVRTGTASAWATRITAKDENGRIAIDTILQPRATE